MKNICEICKIEFESVKPAKTCSSKCRQILSRQSSVTPNVTLADPTVTPTFEFYTVSAKNGLGRLEDEKSAIRKATYWYDVPLGAIPVLKKDWPEVPDYINGRQYFLWWKNDFKVNDKKEPIIHNPFPQYESLTYKSMSSQLGV